MSEQNAIATRQPMDFAQMETSAEVMAASGLFPVWNSKERVMTLMLLCQSEGIDPLSAVNRYDYINGRIAKKATAIQADFQRSGGKVEWVKCTNEVAKVKIVTPDGLKHEEEFTIEDASRAQLVKPNSGWTKYPKAMLRARCITFAIRAVAPEMLNLMMSSEEAVDLPPEREINVTPTVPVEEGNDLEAELTAPEEVEDEKAIEPEVVEPETKESAKNETKTAKKKSEPKKSGKGEEKAVEQGTVGKVAEEVAEDPNAEAKAFIATLDKKKVESFLASINWAPIADLTDENFIYINENKDNFAEKVLAQK